MSDTESSSSDDDNSIFQSPSHSPLPSPVQNPRSNVANPVSPRTRSRISLAREQKMAQKEKAIYEMVDALNQRLEKLNGAVNEKYELCVKDVDPGSGEMSGLGSGGLEIGGAGFALDEMIGEHTDGENTTSNNHHIIPTTGIPDHTRLTWLDHKLPPTDAGHRLERIFTNHLSSLTSHKTKGKKGRSNLGQNSKKNQESRKEARVRLQKILDNNSEHYVTRAVNSITFVMPTDSLMSFGGESSSVVGGGETNAEGVNTDPTIGENWPISLGGNEMRPKILLALSCEKIVMASGDGLIKRLALSRDSCNLFVYIYWFVHCRFFQENSEEEQQYLLKKIAVIFANLLSLKSLDSHKDFFFRHYPFVLGQAIILGFRYLCPGNQSLFTGHFKRILYHTIVKLMTGVDVCPGSVNLLRQQLFPEEILDEEEDVESVLPPIANLTGSRVDDDGVGGMTMGADNTGQHLGGILSVDDEEVVSSSAATNKKTKMSKSASVPNFSRAEVPPVLQYTGGRETLRFRKEKPSFLAGKYLPRQQQFEFDASRISPMLQQFLDHYSDTANRRPHNIKRTEPVKWCRTGGADTHRKLPPQKKQYELIMNRHQAEKKLFRKESHASIKNMVAEVHSVNEERMHILKGGNSAIAKCAIDILKGIQERTKKIHQGGEAKGGEGDTTVDYRFRLPIKE